MKLIDVVQLTNSEYLNMYKLKLINRANNPKDYFVASRRKKEDLTCISKKHDKCDGVMILAITENDEAVILKQYRPAIGDYLYELPAGMIDPNEELEVAAKRELFEETGLKCEEYKLILKPSYSSVGISDETTAIVKMKVSGNVSLVNNEEDEEIEVFLIKKEEVKDYVNNHRFSLKSALILLSIQCLSDS